MKTELHTERITRRERLRWWWRDVRESMIFQVTAVILGVILSVILLAGVMTYTFARPSCHAETAQIGHPARWSFWGACQIQVEDGSWIPLRNYTYIDGPVAK